MGYFKDLEIDIIDMYDESDTDMVSYDDLTFEPNDADYNAEHY